MGDGTDVVAGNYNILALRHSSHARWDYDSGGICWQYYQVRVVNVTDLKDTEKQKVPDETVALFGEHIGCKAVRYYVNKN